MAKRRRRRTLLGGTEKEGGRERVVEGSYLNANLWGGENVKGKQRIDDAVWSFELQLANGGGGTG